MLKSAVSNPKRYAPNGLINFMQCYNVIQKQAFNGKGNPIVLKIHQSFVAEGQNCQLCLGCRLGQTISLLSNYVSNCNKQEDFQNDLVYYLRMQSMIVERIETILDMLNIPKMYRQKHFKVFQRIQGWVYFLRQVPLQLIKFCNANIFYKKYRHNSSFISEKHIQKFYQGEIDLDQIIRIDSNKKMIKKTFILLPNFVSLTFQLCECLKRFVNLLTSNRHYIQLLQKDLILEENMNCSEIEMFER